MEIIAFTLLHYCKLNCNTFLTYYYQLDLAQSTRLKIENIWKNIIVMTSFGIYFITEWVFSNRVKIFLSCDIGAAIRNMQAGNPLQLRITYSIVRSSYQSAKCILDKIQSDCASKCIDYDWYAMSAEDIKHIYDNYKLEDCVGKFEDHDEYDFSELEMYSIRMSNSRQTRGKLEPVEKKRKS